MDIQKLKSAARTRLESAAYDPRRLAFIHTGAALALTALITVIGYILDGQIGNTGGLSGIGMRSVLTTVQTVLQGVGGILLPFWEIGFLAAALAIARGASFGPGILTKGFQKFRTVLRFFIWRLVVTIGIGLGCIYCSSFVFMMTPLADPLLEILEPALQGSALQPEAMLSLDPAVLEAATNAMWPAAAIAFALFVVVMIPVGYRFRIAQFVVLEDTPVRGIGAMLISGKLMRKRNLDFFRLDLQFWWYYLLQALIFVVGYADGILPYLGVELPMGEGVGFFLFFALQVVGQLALLTRVRPMVDTTYALFYEELKKEPFVTKPKPQNFNWDA